MGDNSEVAVEEEGRNASSLKTRTGFFIDENSCARCLFGSIPVEAGPASEAHLPVE